MNNVKIVFSCLLLCMLAFVSSTWAQVTQTYNGVVMDAASGEPLIGVNITQKGTTTVVIDRGVEPGDRVVTAGVYQLQPGEHSPMTGT